MILQSYMKFLARCKLIHEKVNSNDPEELQKYTTNLNEAMNFTGEDIIRPCDLDPCPMKKEHIKGMMNDEIKLILSLLPSFTSFFSGLGKFMQRSATEWKVFVKTRKEVNSFYENPYVDVIFACYLTEEIVQLTLRSKKEHVKPSR